jgi:hypothetical protein
MALAGATGGVVERTVDGDSQTKPIDGKQIATDATIGGAFGAAGKYAKQVAEKAASSSFSSYFTRVDSFEKAGKLAKAAATRREGNQLVT